MNLICCRPPAHNSYWRSPRLLEKHVLTTKMEVSRVPVGLQMGTVTNELVYCMKLVSGDAVGIVGFVDC